MNNKIKYKSNRNIVYSCTYHIIWCPKYRRKVLIEEVGTRLKEIISEVAMELNVEIIEMETDRDHIHILAEIDPQFGVMNFVKKAKGRSKSRVSPPNFKKVKKYKSYTLKGKVGYKLEGNTISLNGYKYKFWKSREIDGKIKTVTIKRDSIGDFYICISLEQEETLPWSWN